MVKFRSLRADNASVGSNGSTDTPGRDLARKATLRLNEGAALLGVSAGTLRRWANEGRVRCIRTPGGQRRFRLEDFAAAGLIDPPSPSDLVGRAGKGGGNGHGSRPRGGALENALLVRQLEQTKRDLEMLVESGLQVGASLDLDQVLRTVATRMALAAGTSYCDVFSLEDGTFRCLVSSGPGGCITPYEGTLLPVEDTGVGGLLVETKQPVAIFDARQDERLSPLDRQDFADCGLRSALAIPLEVNGRVVGTAEVYDTYPRQFENVDVLRALAATAAQAIRNAQVFKAQERQQTRLASLLDASRAISSTLVVDDVLDAIVRKAAEALAANDCIIFAYDSEMDTITPRALYQTDPMGYSDMGETSPLSEYGRGHEILEGGCPVVEYISDPDLDPVSRQSMERWGEKSCLTMPLKFGDEPMGMLVITEGGYERRYTPEELELVTALGDQAAVALHNAVAFQRTEEQNARLGSLINASRAMTSTLVSEELLDTLVRGLADVLGSPECLIYEYHAEDDTIEATTIYQEEPDGFAGLHNRLPLADYPSDRWLLESDEPTTETISDSSLAPDVRESMLKWGEKTCLSVPLRFQGEPLGVLVINETKHERHFRPAEIELVRGFSEQAAMAMHNAHVYKSLQRQNEELAERGRREALINESSMELSSSLELDEVLLAAAGRLTAILDVAACQIFRLIGEGEIVCVAATVGSERDPRWPGRRFALTEWASTRLALDQTSPLAIATVSDPRLGPSESLIMKKNGEKSVLILPLVAKGRVIGSVELVETRREREFTQEEIATAEALCRVVALAVDNAELYSSRERQNRQLASLLDAGRAITSTLVPDEVLELIARQAVRAFQTPWCRIYEYDAERDREVTRVSCRVGPDGAVVVDSPAFGEEFPLAEYPAERAVLSGHEVVVQTVSDPGLDCVTRAWMTRCDLKTTLSVPLWFGDESLGMLSLSEGAAERAFAPAELELARALGDQAATAIHNAKLFQKLELRSDEMALLNQMARRISASLNVGEIAAAVVEELKPLVPIDRATLVLADESGALEVAYSSPHGSAAGGLSPLELDPALAQRAAEEKVVILDLPADGALPPGHPDTDGLRSALIVGLSRDGGLSGGLILASRTVNAFSRVGRDVLDGVGAHLSLAIANARLYENMRTMHLGNLRALSSALSAKDYYTLGHTARVAAYALLLGRELGWSRERLDQLEEVAYLHDIGKIAVSDRVLLKPGPLTDDEWRLMREHPVVGSEIIQGVLPDELVAAVRHHHERYDGKGYPDGLSGAAIPEIARLLCVVDSYDAMSSRRPYRDALTFSQCRAELEWCSGGQFDPEMAAALLRVLDRLDKLKRKAAEVAASAAARIDPAEHALIRDPGDENLPEYGRILDVLLEARASDPLIGSIETERLVDGQRFVVVVHGEPDSAQRDPIGEMQLSDYEESEAFRGHTMDTTVIYVDAKGAWVSGLAPVLSADGTVAALVSADVVVTGSGEGSTFRSEVTETFTALTHSAANRLTRMEIDAVMDSLTGLHNHRYLHERVSEEIGLAAIQGSEVSFLFVDVDHFKSVNDQLGHSSGDEVLWTVAQLVVGCTRRIDVAARYGGDEFAVALIGAGHEEAAEVAERIRSAVEGARLVGPFGHVTVSVGVATFPAHAGTKAELLEKADWAMYVAKRSGRNRCVVYGEDEGRAASMPGDRELKEYLTAMAQLADRRALYLPEHAEAVTRLAEAVALDIGLDPAVAAVIGEAARLRDIGQLPIPDDVLRKTGPLTPSDWESIRAHPRTGTRLLKELTGSATLVEAVLHHHERCDGSGYPDGLSGNDIPLSAAIVAAVSTYQAMLVDRPYRESRPPEEALEELRRCAGSQLDPAVVDSLLRVLSGEGRPAG